MDKYRHCLITFLGVVIVAFAPGQAHAQPGAERPGFHGMLVFGNVGIYISHLPMFTPQHRYQAIWEVSFGAEGDKTYRAELARQGDAARLFTLAPTEQFRLPELTATRNSFKADVFSGHFERRETKPKMILSNVTVELKKLVHWHPFRSSDARPHSLTYLMFGTGTERFLAHWITIAPNYDQILAVTAEARLEQGSPAAHFTVDNRKDEEVLQAGDSVSGSIIVPKKDEQPALATPLTVLVTSQIYLEKGELADSRLSPEP